MDLYKNIILLCRFKALIFEIFGGTYGKESRYC